MKLFFSTTDIILAATLKVHGYELDSIQKQGSKGTFIFKNVDETFLDNFNLGKVTVEPVMFNNAVKHLTTSVRRMSQ